jgi:GNAT superfamily N-acetyltransferase
MTEAEYDVYLPLTVQDYANENVRAGYWTPEESLERSRAAFSQLLPQGVATPDQHLYTIRDTESGKNIGIIWINLQTRRTPPTAFIYDISVDESERGKGYGKATMYAIEDEARRLGAKTIALHVFGHNKTAISLYQKVGYTTTSYNMRKDL